MSLITASKNESFTDEYIHELGFDLSSVIVDYYHPSNPPMIRLEGVNKDKVLNDLLKLNKYIEEAEDQGIVLPFLEGDLIPFVPVKGNEYASSCTYLVLDLYTQTGKKAKNAIRINWWGGQTGWHGELIYGYSGDPEFGKAVRADMYHWHDSIFYAFEIRQIKGQLMLNKIRNGKHSTVWERVL